MAKLTPAAAAFCAFAGSALADVTLFENVRIFDGSTPELSEPVNVLVRDNLIELISAEPIAPEDDAIRIEGGGRTLMPGLIDAHTHLVLAALSLPELTASDPTYPVLRAAGTAENFLMQGFTTARDVGGPVFGLKRAIDEGYLVGPRIFPSGAMLSQTSGHGDFRLMAELPWREDEIHFSEQFGYAAIADGVDQVLRRTRENLMRGASQIKVMAGGGVSSDHDPLDVAQYTAAELEAAVEAASDWNTYVAVHAYTPAAIQKAIGAGVKVIEHGHLADEPTARMMAENGIWWSLQPFLDDQHAIPFPEGSPQRALQLEIVAGTDNAYALAKQHGVKTAWGTDTLFSARLASQQGEQLTKMVRWYTPAEVLKMATQDNGELLALSGQRNPYPGRLGVVDEGALADLLLVDGDVLADIELLNDPGANLMVIMKGGRIYKNTVTP
jgi:imidazolonepropionase-like amidohydrolase